MLDRLSGPLCDDLTVVCHAGLALPLVRAFGLAFEEQTAIRPAVNAITGGVGIDRSAGSAAAGALYQHEVVPPGTRFAARITAAQTTMDTERIGRALDLLVQALAAGRVEIGAARTRGQGQVRLTGITPRTGRSRRPEPGPRLAMRPPRGGSRSPARD